jgi:iron complex outermembrane receptor protein
MNTPASLRRHWPAFVALALTWLATVLSVHAQTPAAGAIQGRVFNPQTKEYVRNAEVRLDGTTRIAYTENDGSFRFDGVPAGSASVTVTYSGYETAKESFNITAGDTAVREINMSTIGAAPKDGVVKLEAFSVSTTREGNAKAVQAQRKDMNIITSVSSDIFGDVMDGNVGEFLKYLPGVDLDYVESEPRGPRLGGMDGQYVGVSFDGMRTANADANRGGGSASRATSFEGFAITSVESVEINRTASPENDADSPAGNVNMKTKRAFDRKGRLFSYNYSLNFNGEEFTLKKMPGTSDSVEAPKQYRWTPNWQLGYAESFANQKFGVLVSASHSLSYTEQAAVTMDMSRGAETALPAGLPAGTALDTRPLVVRDINFGDGPKYITKDAMLLTADWKVTPRLTLSLNLNYSYFEGQFQNRNFDFVGALNNANILQGRRTIGGDGITTVVASRDLTAATGLVNGVVLNNNQARLDNGGGGAAKMTYARQYSPRFEYKNGNWVVDGAFAYSLARNNYDAIERGFDKDEGGTVNGGWIATRPNAQSWEWSIRQTSGADWFDLHSFSNTSTTTGGTRITNDNRTWVTEKYTGTLNFAWNVPFLERFPTKMKFGAKWDNEGRYNRTDTDLNTYAYVGPGGNTVVWNPTTESFRIATFGNWANVGPQYISPFPFDMGTTNSMAGGGVTNIKGQFGMPPRVSRFEMANLYNGHPELWVNMTQPENFYTAMYANARTLQQTITAGYWQADTRFTSKLTVRWGVRAEMTETRAHEFDPLTRPELIARGVALNAPGTNNGRPLTIAGMRTMFETNPKKWRKADYTNWFPSIVTKYQITPQLEWQIGVNKSIGRPAIDDLTGLWTINDNASPPTVTASNPNLKPEYHKVYQSRLAYYFGTRSPGQLSVAVIQDEAVNFVQSKTLNATEFGNDDPDFANYNFITRFNLDTLQRYKNFDFNYNQTLGFLPSEYLRGISVGATYSRSYANSRRNLIAPHRWTGRVGYAYKNFAAQVGAIWVDDRPVDGVVGRYWGAMTKYDISLTYKLTRYATLFLQARNPNNVKDMYYESPPGVKEGEQGVLRKQEEYGDNWILGVRGQF